MMSGPPVSGMAYGAPFPPPRRSRTVPILAAVAALLFIAAAAFGGLYFAKSGDYNRKVDTLKARDATVASQQKQLTDLQAQLKTTQDQLNDANQRATGSQNQVNELTHEKQVISQCIALLGQAADAADAGNTSQAQALAKQADPICNEADKYLD
jgi:uncharacterized protein HemX